MPRLIFIFLLIAVPIMVNRWLDVENPRRPQIADHNQGNLPESTKKDPVYEISPGKGCIRACRGSAFAIDQRGYYLTARHVVRQCSRVILVSDSRHRIPVRRIMHHRRADVSLIETGYSPTGLPLNLSNLDQGQAGFHFGFPNGEAGAVYSHLLGRAWVRRGGADSVHEPVIAWAEARREPPLQGSLGGISGGAVLNASGAVVGVTTAESPRRGRVISAAPRSLSELLQGAKLKGLAQAKERGRERLTAKSFAKVGKGLRDDLRVVQVYCRA